MKAIRFIVPGVCKQCGFSIQAGKRVCDDCKKENRKQASLTNKYEKNLQHFTKFALAAEKTGG